MIYVFHEVIKFIQLELSTFKYFLDFLCFSNMSKKHITRMSFKNDSNFLSAITYLRF